MSQIVLLYLEVIMILGIPLALMGANPLILAARPLLLAIGGIYCGLILRHYHATIKEIGLTRKNFSRSLLHLITPSLIIIAVVLTLLTLAPTPLRLWLIGVDPLSVPTLRARLIFYIFGSAPVQELMFRGYFTYRLQKVITSQFWIVLISTLVFTLAHLPFKSPIMLIIALIMGIFYILNYLKYHNLSSLIISHASVGAILILVRNFYLPYT